MKVGDKIRKRGKGYGVISEINDLGYEVKFLKETHFYEHSKIEIYFACVIWAVAFVAFLYVIL